MIPRECSTVLLNPTKTEALVTGTRPQVQAVNQSAKPCVAGNDTALTDKLCILGDTLYWDDVTYKIHINHANDSPRPTCFCRAVALTVN